MAAAETRPGISTTLMTFIKAKIEGAPGYLSPIEFEKQILGWEHTSKMLKQAGSKQEKAAYPPEDMQHMV